MVKLTRLNGKEFAINIDLIGSIESTPDTVITTVIGTKIVVTESVDEIIDKIVKFNKKIFSK